MSWLDPWLRPVERSPHRPLRTMLVGEGLRPYAVAEELLLKPKKSSERVTSDYLNFVAWTLDAKGRNSKTRHTRFGQTARGEWECNGLAEKHDIAVWNHPIKSKDGVWTKRFRKFVVDNGIELVLMATFGELIPKQHIDLVNGWWINFHPSCRNCQWGGMHSDYGGPKPWEEMAIDHVKLVAIVAHFIDEYFDSGSKIAESQPRVRIPLTHEDRITSKTIERAGGGLRVLDYFHKTEMWKYLHRNHNLMAPATAELVRALAFPLLASVRRNVTVAEFKHIPDGFFASAHYFNAENPET